MCLALVHNYVAQVSNLLYRRFPIGGARDISYAPTFPKLGRLEALRYSRLETGWKPALRLNTYPFRRGEGGVRGPILFGGGVKMRPVSCSEAFLRRCVLVCVLIEL